MSNIAARPNRARPRRGSFMLDAIIAFAFGSFILFGTLYTQSYGLAAVSETENDTLAHWLASNVVNEAIATQQFPKVGSEYEFQVEFAGYKGWAIHRKVDPGGWDTVRRLQVEVFKLPEDQVVKRLPANAVAFASLETFLRAPKGRQSRTAPVGGGL